MIASLNELEHAVLEAFRRGQPTRRWNQVDADGWIAFGLRCLLEAGRVLRRRSNAFHELFDYKRDGSPVTKLELEVELDIRDRLAVFEPSATFIGEETGGTMPESGFAVAVDPVDGTWAMLSETATWACVIAVLADGEPFAGFIVNPVTGELAYAVRGGQARQIRLSTFAEPPTAHTLPTQPAGGDTILVNVHPDRDTREVRTALHDAWRRAELKVVRSAGGSPAWALVEAARGHYVYLNAWTKAPAEPFELAAGAVLVRSAGGELVDVDGNPIDAISHAGPWLAGVDHEKLARVAAIVRDTWPSREGSR